MIDYLVLQIMLSLEGKTSQSISCNSREGVKHFNFCGGVFMSDLNVTDLAVAKLKEYMQANNIDSALRVALMSGG